MKIAVAGIGYVGLSNAVLLSQNHEVIAVARHESKVALVNQRISPIVDPEIEDFFFTHSLNLKATTDACIAYQDAHFVVIATPTDYDPDKDYFNTCSVERVIKTVTDLNPRAVIVVKSTVPLGYTKEIQKQYPEARILFFPEFLREGHALYDNLYPTRIVAGIPDKHEELLDAAHEFAGLLLEGAKEKDTPVLYVDSTEAEAIKLFANTYLAMRVSFFNELDTYAEIKGLDARNIIEGVCLDPRIGTQYNNPSFGYGGYCLPKDTKQLLANYRDVPEELMAAVVQSNKTRKKHIAKQVVKLAVEHKQENGKTGRVGVYRLAMKFGSDNFRQSSILDVMHMIVEEGIEILLYEPGLREDSLPGIQVEKDLQAFIHQSDVIIANRFSEELSACREKVYTRDLYMRD